MPQASNPPTLVGSIFALMVFTSLGLIWALVLFFSLSRILVHTDTDFINGLVLLSALVLLPSNIHMFRCIVKNEPLRYNAQVFCCPLSANLIWGLIVNIVGALVCVYKIFICRRVIFKKVVRGMSLYRTSPVQKRFIDNLQWYLECCGLKSYKDWFNYDWYDKIRDYEWDSSRNPRSAHEDTADVVVDSVPQSCCKSGSCVSNYLTELGTSSIHTIGCTNAAYRFILAFLIVHLAYFIVVIILDIIIFRFSILSRDSCNCGEICDDRYDVKHLMTAKDNFQPSSESYLVGCDESD